MSSNINYVFNTEEEIKKESFNASKSTVENESTNGIIQHEGLRIEVVINNIPSDAVIRKFALTLNELLNCKEGLA